jgi:hypothetical protein
MKVFRNGNLIDTIDQRELQTRSKLYKRSLKAVKRNTKRPVAFKGHSVRHSIGFWNYCKIIFCTILLGACLLPFLPKETQVVQSVEAAPVVEPVVEVKPVDVWTKYFGSQADLMKRICTAESGLDANAIHKNKNGSWDYGICQINTVHSAKWQGQNIFDLEVNLAVAKQILDTSGLTAWSVYNQHKY